MATVHPQSIPVKRITPADGEERECLYTYPINTHLGADNGSQIEWYLEGGASNRMSLALLSGIPSEVEWALSRLVNLSDEHTLRFVLNAVTGMTDAILFWPEIYLAEYSKDATKYASGHFSPTVHVQSIQKHAVECILTLRNASHNPVNATFLATSSKTMNVIRGILQLPVSEFNSELMVTALELLLVVCPHLPPGPKNTSQFYRIPVEALERLVSESTDRSLIIAALSVLSLLMASAVDPADGSIPFYAPTPASPAVRRVIQLAALVQDPQLMTCSLDYLSAFLAHPAASKAFLLDRELANTIKLLIAIIQRENNTESRALPIGPAVQYAQPEEEGPYELTEADLARLVPLPEPDRSLQWCVTLW